MTSWVQRIIHTLPCIGQFLAHVLPWISFYVCEISVNMFILPQGNLSCSDWMMPIDKFPYLMAGVFNLLFWLKLPFDRIKYLSNNLPQDMGFIPHLGFIYPTQLRFAITSVWDESPYPKAGCWISYNVIKVMLCIATNQHCGSDLLVFGSHD